LSQEGWNDSPPIFGENVENLIWIKAVRTIYCACNSNNR